MKYGRKVILAIRRKAVRLQRETEDYSKQGEMSVLAFLMFKPWAKMDAAVQTAALKQLKWNSENLSVKDIIFRSFALEFYLSKWL